MADTAGTPGSSFTLAAEGGVTLELKGRALPYLPLTVTGTQRAEFTWYPGSPQATVQMLGPEEGVITVNGYWKDRFIAGTGDVQVTKEPTTQSDDAATVVATSLSSVAELVRAVDSMRRSGRLIRLSWEGLVRYGHITSFTQTWNTVHDVEWSLDFSVVSQEPLTVPAVSSNTATPADASVSTAALASDMQAQADSQRSLTVGLGVRPAAATSPAAPTTTPAPPSTPSASSPVGASAAMVALPQPLNLPDWLRGDRWRAALESQGWVQATAAWIQWGATSYANIAQQITSTIQFAPNLIRDTVGFASGIVSQVTRSTSNSFDAALTEYFAVTTALGVNSQDQVPFGIQLGNRNYMTNVNNIIRSVRTSNAIWRYEYTRQMQGDVGRVFIAPNDMDLRDVSRIYYGTQDQWAALMLYNELDGSRLRAGQEVRIPENAPYGPAGSTGGGGAR